MFFIGTLIPPSGKALTCLDGVLHLVRNEAAQVFRFQCCLIDADQVLRLVEGRTGTAASVLIQLDAHLPQFRVCLEQAGVFHVIVQVTHLFGPVGAAHGLGTFRQLVVSRQFLFRKFLPVEQSAIQVVEVFPPREISPKPVFAGKPFRVHFEVWHLVAPLSVGTSFPAGSQLDFPCIFFLVYLEK